MPEPAVFGVGTVVYAARPDRKILLLKRAAGGTFTGQWFLPGGAVDAGELPEQGAVRELAEEAGIAPISSLSLIGLYELPGFAIPALMVSYACSVGDGDGDGEPTVSHEHTAFRWAEPEELRDALAGRSGFLGDIHADVERYIAWRR